MNAARYRTRVRPGIHDWMRGKFVHDYPLRFLELGAHHGEDTQTVAGHFQNATSHMWECDPRCLERLDAIFNFQSAFRILPFAVGSACGLAKFYQSGGIVRGQDWDFSGSLRAPTTHLTKYTNVKFPTVIEVPVNTLDNVYRDGYPAFNVVWADIQGAERDMIAGGRKFLSRCEFVYMEAMPEAEYDGQATDVELTEMMRDLGFRNIERFDHNLLFQNDGISDLLE